MEALGKQMEALQRARQPYAARWRRWASAWSRWPQQSRARREDAPVAWHGRADARQRARSRDAALQAQMDGLSQKMEVLSREMEKKAR
jgi:hypothetical protein